MADLERYEIVGSVLICRTCREGSIRYFVKNFGQKAIDVAELHTEISIHESNHHEVVFENNATDNAEAAKRASLELAKRADGASREVRESEYYLCYPPRTAYRDGMVNGMGGAAGDLSGLLGPDAVHALSQALAEVASMGWDYPELVQDHNRKTCEDFTCFIYGHLVDVARAVDGQLQT